jgi:SPP1 family phage portal protein
MKAGVRFWQVDEQKPLRATLYEMDGYTDYIWNKIEENGKQDFKGQILQDKRKYVQIAVTSQIDGTEILDGINYSGFPIVPLWANEEHQNELEGIREQIDCYDLIKSGFANTVDEASYIYWAIQNAGGMDDIDLANFVERMKTVHAGLVEDSNARAEAHTIEAPYESREALLDRLRSDLYEDAMALDTKSIQDGAITATQIRASYRNLDSKADSYEYCLLEFVVGILELAGIDDEATFTRSQIINKQEEVQTVISAGTYLESGYVTEKILTILGDGDKAEDMIKELDADDIRPLVDEGDTDGEEDNLQE